MPTADMASTAVPEIDFIPVYGLHSRTSQPRSAATHCIDFVGAIALPVVLTPLLIHKRLPCLALLGSGVHVNRAVWSLARSMPQVRGMPIRFVLIRVSRTPAAHPFTLIAGMTLREPFVYGSNCARIFNPSHALIQRLLSEIFGVRAPLMLVLTARSS